MIIVTTKYTTQQLREMREMVAGYADTSPIVLDFSTITSYLKDHGVEISEKSGINLGGPVIGVLVESKPKRLEKIMVSAEVYRQLFKKDPASEAVRGLYKVYVSSKYPEKINEVEKLQEKFQIKANIMKGISPLFTGKIIDFRLLEILQEACRSEDYLDEVLLQKIQNYERKAREIRANAEREIEDIIVTATTQLYAEYWPLSKELKGIKEKVNGMRKKVHEESVSLERSA